MYIPDGKLPPAYVHVYGGVPPDAPSEMGVYAKPTSPLWKGRLATARDEPLGEPVGEDVGEDDGELVPPDGDELGLSDGLLVAEELLVGEVSAVVLVCVQAAATRKRAANDAAARTPPLISVVRSVSEVDSRR
jgi:hypothetical protein